MPTTAAGQHQPPFLWVVYLLGLATRMGGRLATFDAGIPLKAVRGATRDTLAVIARA